MPITVSCPACGSRFSLSDDLYRRRVAGSLVKVKCRNCNAEIAVDATDAVTLPSDEAPARKHPTPPRPKAITQMGLGTPPAASELATSSPLPLNATVTPLPIDAATTTPLPGADVESIWSDDQTIAINTAKAPPPIARTAAETDDPELIDAEEIPVSSSGAPTLEALALEAGGAHVPHGKPAPDEFLVAFSASSDGILGTGSDGGGAPTIDVTSFAAEINPPSVDVGLDEEQELEYRPARPAPGTRSRFDLNALQAGIGDAPGLVGSQQAAEDPGAPESRARKFVIAPDAATRTPAPKSRRALWVGLLAASAALGAGVGLYERSTRSAESAQAAFPAPGPVVNTQAALPAEAPTAEPSEAVAAASTASAATNIAVATRRESPSNAAAAVKLSANATTPQAEKPSSVAEPVLEKPPVAVKPIEARNAPAPAAPDTEFDRDAARNALTSAATQASACRKEGDPSGTANLTITFAPSGRVTSAQIQGPPFSGTATGGCIASTMRRANVPAFSGEYVTVSKTIVIQ